MTENVLTQEVKPANVAEQIFEPSQLLPLAQAGNIGSKLRCKECHAEIADITPRTITIAGGFVFDRHIAFLAPCKHRNHWAPAPRKAVKREELVV